jgi:hypothetical protein
MAADQERFAQIEDEAPDPFNAPAHSNALLFAQQDDKEADDAWDDDLFSKPAGEAVDDPPPPGRHRV